MSQDTRDIFHSVRDYIALAAKELAERESTAIANQIELHTQWVDDEATSASKKTEYKAALKQLEKRQGNGTGRAAGRPGLPALAVMLGKKSEADVDAAAMN